MASEVQTCAVCGEPARLHCAGCDGVFCVEHVERRFAMGYFYFCAACLARQEEAATAASKRRRKKQPET
ncbi:MAG: hypothetical protein JWO42_3246 [Chloroflexi bacterium]|jgi:hypothetical protein|nr:hypothetical protein [Chloroflexota bacterium]